MICHLIFVAPSQRLSPEAERKEYDKHQNFADDSGYQVFLSRIFAPLHARLRSNSRGLDFGSGPGPVLSLMFEKAGHHVSVFDPFYAPDKSVLSRKFDFITATEVVEHLYDPATELAQLWSLLNPGGWLGIMTKLALDQTAFTSWHYRRDPTHVCFFSLDTIEWLANKWGAELQVIGKDVFLFRK